LQIRKTQNAEVLPEVVFVLQSRIQTLSDEEAIEGIKILVVAHTQLPPEFSLSFSFSPSLLKNIWSNQNKESLTLSLVITVCVVSIFVQGKANVQEIGLCSFQHKSE